MLAATVLGLLAGIAVTLLLPTTYRAEASLVLARQGEAPGETASLSGAAEAAGELLESRTVAESAVANLRLDESAQELLDRVDVDTGARSSLLRLSVNGGEPEDAQRTAQELAQVFTVLYNSRFGPAVTASVWEGARVSEDPVSPRRALNLLLGGLLGAAIGVAVAALRRAPARRPLDDRIAALTARERALARRAAELSLRERGLGTAQPVESPPPERSREAFERPDRGQWTIDDLERLVAQHGPEFPERADELNTYLDSIRGVAESDGSLPAGVEVLVEDVFAELIARAR